MADEKSPLAEIKTMLEKIAGGLRTPPNRDDDDDEYDGKQGAQRRIHQLIRQRDDAERRAREAIETAQKATEAAEHELVQLRTQIDEVKQSAAQDVGRVRQEYDDARQLGQLGITDDDGIAEARRKFGQLPEDKRPESIVDWWRGLDEQSAPRTLQGYLGDRPKADGEEKRATGRPPPDVDRGRGKPPAAKDPRDMSGEEYDSWLRSDAAWQSET